MDCLILVNKDNRLDKDFIPDDLVNSFSKYKDGILVNKNLLDSFNKMKMDMNKLGYDIDIMSGYRDYHYQEKIYNESLKNKGYAYTFRSIALPGASEHQTGLAIDICIYRDNKCYIEYEIDDLIETRWLHENAYKYGFILRYPKGCEDVTGFNYEPWHFRYVGDVAEDVYKSNLVYDEYKKKY